MDHNFLIVGPDRLVHATQICVAIMRLLKHLRCLRIRLLGRTVPQHSILIRTRSRENVRLLIRMRDRSGSCPTKDQRS